ncbi:MAG: phenylacetate--CoA ligase family protein, partial [Pseudomonadota bacterium]
PDYFAAMQIETLRRDWPVDGYWDAWRLRSRDGLRAWQERRLQTVLASAWRVPFYRNLWGAAGAEPGDIRGLEDLGRLPTYDKSDLMAAVEEQPPLGNLRSPPGGASADDQSLILHTTSGTTGRPQPLLWGPRSREIQNVLLARLYLLHGMRPDDVVHSVYGFGTVNGGHYIREAIQHWIGATVIPAGTGAETRSAQQILLMRDFHATVLVGFGDYLIKLAEVAREAGMEPGHALPVRMISGHFGTDGAASLAAAWGTERVYDWYGVGDTGAIAGQGPERSGMHVLEDAHIVELVEPGTQEPVEDGLAGDLVCTCLYKDDVFPIIRFQTHDVTRFLPGPNPLGVPFRRIAGHLGRSDNMVKLRGINVYPQGIGAILWAQFGIREYVCRVSNSGGRQEMTVMVEAERADQADGEREGDDLAASVADTLRNRLGVAVAVETHAPGTTAALTGLESRQKPVRLVFDG